MTTKNPAIAAELRNMGKLPLNYDCHGPKNEPVCCYIEQTWRTMVAEAMTSAMACRESKWIATRTQLTSQIYWR